MSKEVITSIGIDTSLTGTGIVVLENGKITKQQLIKSKPSGDKPVNEVKRIQKIVEEIELIVSEYMPRIAVIEGLAYLAKGTSLVQLAALNYMTRAMLMNYHIPFVIVFPTTLKKFATGNGAAKKDEILLATFKRYGVTIMDDNEADAYNLSQIGLALLGGNSKDTNQKQEEVLTLLKTQL